MKKIYWLYATLLFLIFFIAISSYGMLFPSDVLRNIPSFSEDGWQRPKNALQSDPVYQFEPWRDFAKSELLSGRIPLWNNINGNGAPLLANSINAALYPLNFLYYILPVELSISLINLLKLVLFFTFLYLYLRILTIHRSIAFLGAMAGTFSGYMLLWLYWPQTNVYLLLPLVLYATEHIHRSQNRRYIWYALISISYFLMILGNHPETLFHIGLLHSGYIIFRFWKDYMTILAIFCSIFVGFLLGSLQLLPLLEYLRYSYVLENRSLIPHNFSLPFLSILLMILPFMFGAPHLPYYRHVTQSTNFQEVLGGYTGIIILLASAIAIFRYSKDVFIRFWTIVVLLSFAMSYNIWPIKYLNSLPLMSTSANHRLIAFVNFGLIIIFCLALQRFITVPHLKNAKAHLADKVFLLLTLIVVVATIVLGIYLPEHLPKYANFIPFFLWHVLFISLATIFFFWSVAWYMQKRISSQILIIIVTILVGLQTVGLFWNYNPLVDKKYFYPQTEVVKMLLAQPKGNIIEIGNPSLPPNINMKYGIPHAINNDAVEVLWYRHAIKDTFENYNHWGNPESITLEQLRRLHVLYVLSDYDLRLASTKIQPDGSKILHPITTSSPYIVNFKPPVDNISELRVRTANYNRENSCHLSFKLFVKSTHQEVMDKQVPCVDIRNNMFYTMQVPRVGLDTATEYQLEVHSDTNNDKNAVALYGNHNKPYLELLSEAEAPKNYLTEIGKTKTTYVWKVNGIKLVDGADTYKVLSENPQQLVLDVTSKKPTKILIKKTFYPGWHAKVNGKSFPVTNGNPYISLKTPEGRSYIELSYNPFSFRLGFALSFLTAIGLGIYLLRNSRESILDAYSKISIDKKIKKTPFWQHVAFISLSLLVSAILFAIFSSAIPLELENPWTTAINWFTKHEYSRFQDYVYFYGGFAFISIVTFASWIVWIWKKRK